MYQPHEEVNTRLHRLRTLEQTTRFKISATRAQRLLDQLAGHVPDRAAEINQLAALLREMSRSARSVFAKVQP